MDREEFKRLFKELCESGDLELNLHVKHGRLHVGIRIDGQRVADDSTYCSSIKDAE